MEFKPGDIVVHTITDIRGVHKNKYVILDEGCKDYKFVKVYCLDGEGAFAGRIFHFRQNSLAKYR